MNLPYSDYIARTTYVNVIKAKTERLLWHQRLGHLNNHQLANAHKFVDGVPQFLGKHDDILDSCPVCIEAKLTKRGPGDGTTRVATQPYQGLSVDFAFSGTIGKDKSRRKDIVGFNGENCYILI